jgi:hypothetical protein
MKYKKLTGVVFLAGILALCSLAVTAAPMEKRILPAVDNVPIGQHSVILDIPQREYIAGEPIHVFVGLRNGSESPAVVANVNSNISIEVRNPKGNLCLPLMVLCGARPTTIEAHSTLWVHFDLAYFTNTDQKGKYRVTARVYGTKPVDKGAISTGGEVLRSETIEVTVAEPTGADKSAIDWLRGQLRDEAKLIGSDSDRATIETMLSYALVKHSGTMAQAFPGSLLGKHAEYYLTESRYSLYEASVGKGGEDRVEALQRSFRSIAEGTSSPALALLARIGEKKAEVSLGKTASAPDDAVRKSGFAEQEIQATAKAVASRAK